MLKGKMLNRQLPVLRPESMRHGTWNIGKTGEMVEVQIKPQDG